MKKNKGKSIHHKKILGGILATVLSFAIIASADISSIGKKIATDSASSDGGGATSDSSSGGGGVAADTNFRPDTTNSTDGRDQFKAPDNQNPIPQDGLNFDRQNPSNGGNTEDSCRNMHGSWMPDSTGSTGRCDFSNVGNTTDNQNKDGNRQQNSGFQPFAGMCSNNTAMGCVKAETGEFVSSPRVGTDGQPVCSTGLTPQCGDFQMNNQQNQDQGNMMKQNNDQQQKHDQQDLQRIQKDGANMAKQLQRRQKELDDIVKRIGSTGDMTAVNEAKTAIAAAQPLVDAMVNATADTLDQARTAQNQLFGNEDSNSGIWRTIDTAMQKAHMQQGISQMQQNMDRQLAEMTKQLSRVTDAATKTQLTDIITQLKALKPDFTSCESGDNGGDMGNCDAMQNYQDSVESLSQKFWDIMQSQNEDMKQTDVCGRFDKIRQGISNAENNIPASMIEKVKALLDQGTGFCSSGDVDSASRILDQLFQLKRQNDSMQNSDNKNPNDQTDLSSIKGFDNLNMDAALKQALGSDVSPEVLDRVKALLNSQISAAIDTLNQQLALKMARMQTQFDSKVADMQKNSLANVNTGFSGSVRDGIMRSKTDLADAYAPLDKIVSQIESQNVEIPADLKNTLQSIYEFVTVRNFTADGANKVRAEIDTLTTAVSASADANAEVAVLTTEAPKALSAIQSIYNDDQSKQLSDGILKFKDLSAHEGDWYTSALNGAASNCIVSGKTNPDGTKIADANGTTSWAEALTMIRRATTGCSGKTTTEVDDSNTIVRGMPDYAKAPVTYLIQSGKIDKDTLARIYGNHKASDSISRIEMMEVVYKVFNIPASDTSILSKFSDAAGLSDSAKEAASALINAGIVQGEGSGDLNPNGTLNRAAFAKIMTSNAFQTPHSLPTPIGGSVKTTK